MSWGAVAGAAVSVVGGALLSDGGGGGGGGESQAAIISAEAQAEALKKQEVRNDEMWGRFKEKYYPLEDKLLDPAYREVADKSELRAAEAGDAVTSAFAGQRAQSNRALTRVGVNPADGQYRALNRTLDMGEAAASADAQNDARVAEQQRVEDTNFNRSLQVMSLGRNIPAQVSGSGASTAAGYGANAGIYTNLAQMLAKDSGDKANAVGNLVSKGVNAFGGSNFNGNTFSGNTSAGADAQSSGAVSNAVIDSGYMREGGPVRGPSHEAGGVDIEAEGGEYVVPVEVVNDIGMGKLDAMVQAAKKRIAERENQKRRPPQAMRRV